MEVWQETEVCLSLFLLWGLWGRLKPLGPRESESSRPRRDSRQVWWIISGVYNFLCPDPPDIHQHVSALDFAQPDCLSPTIARPWPGHGLAMAGPWPHPPTHPTNSTHPTHPPQPTHPTPCAPRPQPHPHSQPPSPNKKNSPRSTSNLPPRPPVGPEGFGVGR